MKIDYLTNIGTRELNEDSVNYAYDFNDKLLMGVVADGVGGQQAGEVASKLITDNFYFDFRNAKFDALEDVVDWIKLEINKVNSIVYKHALDSDKLQGMASTLVCVVTDSKRAIIANVGDSRAYLVHNQNIKQVTVDHSLLNELKRQGSVDESEIKKYAKSNVITRAIGGEVEAHADIYFIDIAKDDEILLCTDGLNKSLKDDEILKIMLTHNNIGKQAELLIDNALRVNIGDNVTVLLFSAEEGGEV